MKDDIREIVIDYTERATEKVATMKKKEFAPLGKDHSLILGAIQEAMTEVLDQWAEGLEDREEETDIPF